MVFQRQIRWYDTVFTGALECIRTIHKIPSSLKNENNDNLVRMNPAHNLEEKSLSDHDRRQSGRLMRVNHSGEVCAQALYLGQGLVARNINLKHAFSMAAKEEEDHLRWCEERLAELHTTPSKLNPLWFTGSFIIGMGMGLMGDKLSLGFLAETENQVYTHLGKHLDRIAHEDIKSRAILLQMQQDEAQHALQATQKGGIPFPSLAKKGMQLTSQLMTTVAYYV